MILLTSLLPTSGNVILRNNQQTSTPDEPIYDLINIDVFKNNIYEYLDNRTIDKDKFIYDMICLSSMFGNDFIPKIESIDVQYNFEQLLDIYMKTFIFFNENNDDTYYLIEFNKNKKQCLQKSQWKPNKITKISQAQHKLSSPSINSLRCIQKTNSKTMNRYKNKNLKTRMEINWRTQ
jgi:hypothetical protein